jgi:hypothetical protein
MKYNLASLEEVRKAYEYLKQLSDKQAVVEVKKVSPTRSLSQNNYLHLLLTAFGLHFGYTQEEAKLIYKDLNKDIYYYKKTVRDVERTFIRSSADITKEEMGQSLEVLHYWSATAGYPLPAATDQEWLRQIENEIERSKHKL